MDNAASDESATNGKKSKENQLIVWDNFLAGLQCAHIHVEKRGQKLKLA